MGVVATLLPQSARVQRLRSAVRDRHSIVACATWDEIVHACEQEPVQIVLVDLYAEGTANFERVRRLKLRFPRLTLVAYVSVNPERARDMFDAGRSGLDGLIIADHDDTPRNLFALIEQAEARSIAGLLRRSLGEVRPTVRDAILIAVSRAHERLTPQGLARIVGMQNRLLSKRLTLAGFPTPQRLIAWGRLIVAARMLEDRHRSADSVASALDFPSGSAFRNTCQRYVHATPNEIRDRGGAAYVVRALLRQIHAPTLRVSPLARRTSRIPLLAV